MHTYLVCRCAQVRHWGDVRAVRAAFAAAGGDLAAGGRRVLRRSRRLSWDAAITDDGRAYPVQDGDLALAAGQRPDRGHDVQMRGDPVIGGGRDHEVPVGCRGVIGQKAPFPGPGFQAAQGPDVLMTGCRQPRVPLSTALGGRVPALCSHTTPKDRYNSSESHLSQEAGCLPSSLPPGSITPTG
jgi:hypothetical protein